MAVRFVPVSPARWEDFVRLFGPRGACAGCWCMWARLPAAEWKRGAGSVNKGRMKKIVDAGARAAAGPPGLLAYVDGEPAGWVAFAPREDYVRLERSRVWKRVDEQPVWSVSCFFVARPHRRKGLTVALLRAAAAHVKKRGARVLEGYPVDPAGKSTPDPFAWTGLVDTFRKAGFHEVARRSPSKPVMRLEL